MRELKFKARTSKGRVVEFTLAELLATSPEYKDVKLATVKQYCDGDDKHGRAVYEGDTLRSVFNGVVYDYKAHYEGYATTANGEYIPASKFKERELI